MNKWIKRIISIIMIVLGIILGVTWNKNGLCIGDNLFSTLGLPAWSHGTSFNRGTHYPAVIGTILILVGLNVFNYTLKVNYQKWFWASVLIFFSVIIFVFNILLD